MKNYQTKILERLLDKYEKSKSFIGANAVTQTFTLDLAKEFPEYADDSRAGEIRAIVEAAEELEEEGLVARRYRKNGLLYAVTLKRESLPACYSFLKRKPKSEQNEELKAIYRRFATEGPLLSAFCEKQLARIAENKKPEHFHGDTAELEKVLTAVKEALQVEQETFERDFSIRVFGDSKVFERIRGSVTSILFEYGDFPEKETVLEDLNIVRNPGHVFLKGAGVLRVAGQTLDLRLLGGDIAFSSVLLKEIERIEVTGQRVITIENLTSFNAYTPKEELVVYLGGYHNLSRREFLKRVYEQNPNAAYFHCGDIDAGGFYILLHLRAKTGIPFAPLHMGVQTLKQNLRYAKKLTENDARRLKNLKDGEFEEVIAFMLKENVKLEQEALDIHF